MNVREWINWAGRKWWLDGLTRSISRYRENGPMRALIVVAYIGAPLLLIDVVFSVTYLLLRAIEPGTGIDAAASIRPHLVTVWGLTAVFLVFGIGLMMIYELVIWVYPNIK